MSLAMPLLSQEAQFLLSNAAKIRSLAWRAPSAIRDEFLVVARELEARATALEKNREDQNRAGR